MQRKHNPWSGFACVLMLLPILVGCGSFEAQQPITNPSLPTPTLGQSFGVHPIPTLPPIPTDSMIPDQTVIPVQATDRPTKLREEDVLVERPVYSTVLDKNWTLEHSAGVTYLLGETAYTHGGTVAAAVTPTKDYGTFFFTVRPTSTTIYPRNRVLGLRFWLSGGSHPIYNDALAVTVVGSNKYPYWVANDNSVTINATVTPESPLFSETRLYFLGINRTIPPHTWVEIDVWLDDLRYDPDYSYVTGMYIKNDAKFLQTYYIAQMRLLIKK